VKLVSLFKSQFWNDAYAIFVNLPTCIPYAMSFKVYHMEHHRYQGWDGVDADIPLPGEAAFFRGIFGKLFFCIFQIPFYAVRPVLVHPLPISARVVVNYVVILSWVAFLWSVNPNYVLYLITSTFFAGMLHPMAGHFISEHYMRIFHPTSDQETFSYYGPLNFFAWNVGLHNEHHDFPNIPWTRLPLLRKIAPEFYEPLVKVDSWPGTIYRFITNPSVTLYSRMKRERGAYLRTNLLSSPKTPNDTTSKPTFN